MPETRRFFSPLSVLLLLLMMWGGWFIYRSSFMVGEKRYFCLFDDAMISMTYARNLVEGHGLNWARWGEPVEGFTHPLWLLLMVPINALPVPLPDRSLLVQILSLLALAGTVIAVRRLVLAHFSQANARHWMPAAVLTAFYYPLSYWALLGMETALQALLAVLAVHLSLSAVHAGRDRHLPLWLVCTAAFLLRMDMLPLVVAVQLYLLLRGGLRPAGRRSWFAGLAVFCGVSLAYELFRWFYFHDLLPNTYYLKLTGVALTIRVLRGISVLAAFLRDHLLFILPVGLGAGVLTRRNTRLVLPAAVFALYCAYNVYTGGDAWDGDLRLRANRFIAFVMPLLFVLFNAVLNAVLSSWRSGKQERAESLLEPFVTAAATAVSLLLLNGLWLSSRADDYWRDLTLTSRPPMTDRHQRVIGQLRAIQEIVRPGAVVASVWAGIPAYFSDYRMIDVLGYNDRITARMSPVVHIGENDLRLFRPGHIKWDQERLLRQRPDAFFQIWARGMGQIAEVLPRLGYQRMMGRFWIRSDSPYFQAPAAAPSTAPSRRGNRSTANRRRPPQAPPGQRSDRSPRSSPSPARPTPG